jgi:EAL domain-containing protein (putative c-di-GMP-specific phosphodiesterase class I)
MKAMPPSCARQSTSRGIEDEPTFERLRAMGCDVAQGYWISKPLAAAQVPMFLPKSTKIRYA